MSTHDCTRQGTIAGLAVGSFIVLMALPMTAAVGQNPDEQSTRQAFSAGAQAYESGDYATAMQILMPLAERNITGALTYVGRMHQLGRGVKKDGAEARQWYLRAAKNGGSVAGLNLAIMYQEGDGIERNLEAAIRWFRFATANGDPYAPNNLGALYAGRDGVSKDLIEAFAWFSVAIDMGNETAIENLKEVASKLTSEQIQTGRQHYQALRARLPEWRAMPSPSNKQAGPQPSKVQRFDAALAERGRQAYLAGDYAAAMPILLQQAEAGHAQSQFFVARMLEKGRGTTRNDREAVKWYTLSARGGVPASLDNLGLMYLSGRGVDEDPASAAALFYLAATQGNRGGQLNYGYCCATGTGRPKNLVEGRAWYQLAVDQGDQVAARNIPVCEGEMTAQQLDQARQRAAELLKLVQTEGFDRNSMPKVPIAPFLGGSPQSEQGPGGQQPPRPLPDDIPPQGELTPARPGGGPAAPAIPDPWSRTGPGAPMHPLFAGMPMATNLGAPDWIKPGMQITFWCGSASILGTAGGSTLVADPNGIWVSADGKRYREGTVGSGSGGAGFTRIDVIAVTPNAVIMDMRTYTGDGQVSQPSYSTVSGIASHPSGCEYWVNPKLLQQLEPGIHNGVRIMKASYPINGATYDAVMLQSISATGSMHYVYDSKTGVCLSAGSRSTSRSTHTSFDPSTGIYGPGSSVNTMITATRFAAAKAVKIPWAGQTMPAWLEQVNGFRLKGHYVMDMKMGLQPQVISIDATLTFKRKAPGLIEYELSSAMQSIVQGMPAPPPNVSVRYATPAQIGSLWMNPESLSRLKQGTVIDEDRVTGYRTFIEYVGTNSGGKSVVVLTEQGRSAAQQWVYDARSGLLVSGILVQQLGGVTPTECRIEVHVVDSF